MIPKYTFICDGLALQECEIVYTKDGYQYEAKHDYVIYLSVISSKYRVLLYTYFSLNPRKSSFIYHI